MFFSIIIPTCNRNDLLATCLDKLHTTVQNFPANDYEVIVTDDSYNNLAQQFIANNYDWVKWVSGPKRGPASNRNNGAKHAKGDWLLFLDDDVTPDSTIINNYLSVLNQHPKIKVFEGYVNADRPRQRFDEESPINTSGGNLWSCNFLIERELFFDLNGFDETFPYAAMEDIDFHQRIKNRALTIHFVEKCKVIHPWRRVVAFKTIKKHFRSHRHFKKLHYNTLDYRWMRFKVFLGSFYPMLKELIKYKFKGYLLLIDRTLLNFVLIFA